MDRSGMVCVFWSKYIPHYGGALYYHHNHFLPRLFNQEIRGFVLTLRDSDQQYEENLNGIKIIRGNRVMGRSSVGNALASLLHLLRHLGKYKVVYFADGGGTAWLAIPVLKLLGKRIIVESTLVGKDNASARKKQKLGRIKTYILRKVDRVICISTALYEDFMQNKFEEQKVVNLIYGIDLNKYKILSASEKLQVREELNINSDQIVVASVGGINKRKNIEFLVRCFAKAVKQTGVDARLMLIGPYDKAGYGGYINKVRTVIREYGIKERVYFAGLVNNVENYLQAADIYATTSVAEGLGLGVIEAMACGNAVVSLDIDVTHDLIPDEKYGIVIRKNDEERYVDALVKLLTNPELRRRLAINSHKRVAEKFDIEKRVREMTEIIKDISN